MSWNQKILATKAQSHEKILFCYSFLVSWCFSGEKKIILPQKAQTIQLRN